MIVAETQVNDIKPVLKVFIRFSATGCKIALIIATDEECVDKIRMLVKYCNGGGRGGHYSKQIELPGTVKHTYGNKASRVHRHLEVVRHTFPTKKHFPC